MKHKIFLIVSGILLGVLLVSVFCMVDREKVGEWFFGTPTEIKSGFSPELLNAMKERYQITIPDDAVFIKGIVTDGFREGFVVFLFELPMETKLDLGDDRGASDYVFQRLNLDESQYELCGRGRNFTDDWDEDFVRKYDHEISAKHDVYTFLSFSVQEDRIIFRFVGWRPGEAFYRLGG